MRSIQVKSLLLVFLFVFVPFVNSRERSEVLPKGLTESEKSIISQFQFRNSRVTEPPTGPVRAAAEWEEVEYLVIRWTNSFQNILK